MRIVKINTILKRPVNKLFAIENTCHDTKQTDKVSHKEIASQFPCCPSELWIFVKENPDKKETDSALHLRTDFWSIMGEECFNALLPVCIHRDIFLDYDKIINIYVSKYPKKILLLQT